MTTTSEVATVETYEKLSKDAGKAPNSLEETVARLGELTGGMVRDAVTCLWRQEDTDRHAEEIATRDDEVDTLDADAEREVLARFAAAPPRSARDARAIGNALKITKDYERIGDHAVNIARTAHRIRYANLTYTPYFDMERFGVMVCRMIEGVTDAYVRGDAAAAEAVIEADDEVDVFYREATRELRNAMTEIGATPDRVLLCSHLLFVCHYLERIGDHCCSVAERVILNERGRARVRVPVRTRRLPRK